MLKASIHRTQKAWRSEDGTLRAEYQQVSQIGSVYGESYLKVIFHHFNELLVINLVVLVDIYFLDKLFDFSLWDS